jgi:hypothetical protein
VPADGRSVIGGSTALIGMTPTFSVVGQRRRTPKAKPTMALSEIKSGAARNRMGQVNLAHELD